MIVEEYCEGVKLMDITVNKQAQQFYLALEKWTPVMGHEIKIGKYRFCAIPIKNQINISEVSTGAKLFNIPVNLIVNLRTETKEDTIKYLNEVGGSIKRVIEKQTDFDGMLSEMKKTTFENLGKMPPIENGNVDWMLEEQSDVLN